MRPARVSVVTSIGYTAFLAGPPLVGLLGNHVGTLDSLLAVAVIASVGTARVQRGQSSAGCTPRSDVSY